jgi:lambda family phage portal protein
MNYNWQKTQTGLLVPPGTQSVRVRRVHARYDAAQTTSENTRHWSFADGLSADAANSISIRQTLRNRARYEVANNTYAKGIVLTIANDCIGTGPRLQMMLDEREISQALEKDFNAWAEEINLAEKLRTMRMAKATDGEAFAVLTTNPKLNSRIKLDLQLFEAEQITTPFERNKYGDSVVDGIEFDQYGNPRIYYVLLYHPGGNIGLSQQIKKVPAESMIHWFRIDRPGQHRGVPEITSALPLFAQLRRYTLATISAAETAANFAGILETGNPNEDDLIAPFDSFDIERNMLTTLPGKLSQLKAEQPTTTYAEFKKEILNEIARCLNLPYNIAACNSSAYNYASGRLDHQTYYKSLSVEQHNLEMVGLNKILRAWMQEAILEGIAPMMPNYPHEWFWDGTEHVDPAKEASAQATRLQSLTTTLAAEYAKQGKDWEKEIEQAAREREKLKQLGLTMVPTDKNSKETADEKETANAE